jgi:amicyanin
MEWYVQLLAKVFENSLLIVTVIFLSGCIQQQAQKESGFASTQSSQKESVYIKIKNFAFDPATITLKVGTTVTWINEDSASHTITSEGKFDSGILNKGDTFSYTFNEAGTFEYICTLHPKMKGRVIVEE